jgi:hypothetical protein
MLVGGGLAASPPRASPPWPGRSRSVAAASPGRLPRLGQGGGADGGQQHRRRLSASGAAGGGDGRWFPRLGTRDAVVDLRFPRAKVAAPPAFPPASPLPPRPDPAGRPCSRARGSRRWWRRRTSRPRGSSTASAAARHARAPAPPPRPRRRGPSRRDHPWAMLGRCDLSVWPRGGPHPSVQRITPPGRHGPRRPGVSRGSFGALLAVLKKCSNRAQKGDCQYGPSQDPLNDALARPPPPLIEGRRHRVVLWAGRARPGGHIFPKPCDHGVLRRPS